MGIFDELRKKTPENKAKEPVIKAEKRLYKKYMFGHISNGGGIVRLDDEYALKFVANDDEFVTIFLLDYGKELTMPTQTWQKSKIVEKNKGVTINKEETIEKKDLF